MVVFALSVVAGSGITVWLISVFSRKCSYGLPHCPDPPPPRETWVFPKGMNYSTGAKAMKVETMSLEAVREYCLMESWKRHLPWPVIITDIIGFAKLAEALPKPLAPAEPMTPYTGTFCEVPVKQYPFEGLARAAAIVAEADGYDVMLFLPGEVLPATDTDVENMDEVDEGDKRLTESKKSAER